MALSQTSFWEAVYLLSGGHLLFHAQRQKHLQLKETWLPVTSAVSRNQIIARTGSRVLSRKAELAEAVLQMNAYNSGAMTGKGEVRRARCVEEATPKGKLLAEERCLLQTGQSDRILSVLQTSD